MGMTPQHFNIQGRRKQSADGQVQLNVCGEATNNSHTNFGSS